MGAGAGSASPLPRRGLQAMLDVVQDLEHPGAALGRVVLLDVQLGDALQSQVAQSMPHEGHRPPQRTQ